LRIRRERREAGLGGWCPLVLNGSGRLSEISEQEAKTSGPGRLELLADKSPMHNWEMLFDPSPDFSQASIHPKSKFCNP
jgi:hypothetical protein